MEDPRECLLHALDDARAAEEEIADTLKGFIDEVENETARVAFQQHMTQTRSQADRLEKRLRALGGEPSGGKSMVGALAGKLSGLFPGGHDAWDRATRDVVQAYATEHLEIGMYAALAAYARACGDAQTAALAEQILTEEEQAADALRPLIPTCSADAYTTAIKKRAA